VRATVASCWPSRQATSGVEAGRGTLVVDPKHPGRVYLGNAGVIQIDD
jgi:hypothetical protein